MCCGEEVAPTEVAEPAVLLAFVAMPRSHHAQPEPHDPAIEDVLGPLGAAVMRTVWAQGESSVSSVLDTLNAERPRPLAYTTVMTIMARLFERGLLEREKQGRQYVYRPASDEHALLETLSGRAVDDLLARYGTTALHQFAQRLAGADPELRDRILELASRRRP
jgi:Predicted transcriptional regulator